MPNTIFTTPQRFGADVVRLCDELLARNAAGIERAMRRAAHEGKIAIIDAIDSTRPHPPVDTGKMRASVDVKNVPGGAVLENRTPQAAWMEFGTAPHTPPIGALLSWVKRKRIIPAKGSAYALARAIQFKIAKRGTAPRGFWARASQRFPEMVHRHVLAELSRIAASDFRRIVR